MANDKGLTMLTAISIFIIFGVFAMLYLESLWSNAITLINVTLSCVIALCFFEPLATFAESYARSFTYFWDFLSMGFLFVVTFAIMRLLTDLMSRTRVKFRAPIEIPGRLICAFLVAVVMVSFILCLMHVAPLPAAPFNGGLGQSPTQPTILIFSPDRGLLAFTQMVSRGSLSRGAVAGVPPHPDDANMNVNAFDPKATFVLKYRQRRRDLEKLGEVDESRRGFGGLRVGDDDRKAQ
jgi:hypothetical protein